jgi:hypothetical protein
MDLRDARRMEMERPHDYRRTGDSESCMAKLLSGRANWLISEAGEAGVAKC